MKAVAAATAVGAAESAAAASLHSQNLQGQKQYAKRESGIETWTDADVIEALRIESSTHPATLQQVVNILTTKGKPCYPSNIIHGIREFSVVEQQAGEKTSGAERYERLKEASKQSVTASMRPGEVQVSPTSKKRHSGDSEGFEGSSTLSSFLPSFTPPAVADSVTVTECKEKREIPSSAKEMFSMLKKNHPIEKKFTGGDNSQDELILNSVKKGNGDV